MLKHLLLPLTALVIVCADDYDHRYKEGDRVDLWVNKVRDVNCLNDLLTKGGIWGVCFNVDKIIRINNFGGRGRELEFKFHQHHRPQPGHCMNYFRS